MDRTVTTTGETLGAVTVRVKRPGSEATYATTGTVKRTSQAGEIFYAWETTTGDRGTNARYIGAVETAAQHIERAEGRP